jgi:hypothetical protein
MFQYKFAIFRDGRTAAKQVAIGFQNWHFVLPEYGTLIPKHLIGETKDLL